MCRGKALPTQPFTALSIDEAILRVNIPAVLHNAECSMVLQLEQVSSVARYEVFHAAMQHNVVCSLWRQPSKWVTHMPKMYKKPANTTCARGPAAQTSVPP